MAATASNRDHQLKLMYDKYVRYLFIASAFLMTIIIISIIVFVGQQGLMTFKEVSPMEFFFSAKWDPTENQYGALSFIAGSVYVTVLAVLLGAPLGLAGAIFMAKIAPDWLREIMRPATDLYVAIPSVVYGYVGLTVLVPFIREFFQVNTGFGLFAAALILSIMILPTIISISEDAIRAVPKTLEEASLALGATRWQTITKVLLPSALPGILTAVILAMARAIGETMAVQMVIGNTPQLAKSLFTPTSTLPSEIVVEMGNTPFGSAWGNSLFLMALVLLILSIVMILIIRQIAARRVV
ncbi:phosphate ABC transporter permease subunit PstC [Sporomusa sphaeroides]|jgi:phosphate transport system permease protein|uniref:Phosphate transport system permease protein n=3 Tax=Sporomusa TaxID=2375 RepID=A0ABM9W0U8_9FIRM|nr:phosphate ABC transporter permease subunit PstC [Sporomusa sphaeroides]OLS56831.1 phosphate transport system permease protein PstC [Sporomusa sphaeroides DSM 2875]CVK18778.1 Phosphate transport system permease protein PstC [Sporomusa sphaeroides DSM 2875]SCM81919.1 putative ABC transporter permease protein YqgH [uncultured Sporomusa sp.]